MRTSGLADAKPGVAWCSAMESCGFSEPGEIDDLAQRLAPGAAGGDRRLIENAETEDGLTRCHDV
jgi:hypothetical protein